MSNEAKPTSREPFIPPKPATPVPLSQRSERDQIISIFTTTVKIAQSGQLTPELFLSVADHLGRLAERTDR
jgi:hypothetical protein